MGHSCASTRCQTAGARWARRRTSGRRFARRSFPPAGRSPRLANAAGGEAAQILEFQVALARRRGLPRAGFCGDWRRNAGGRGLVVGSRRADRGLQFRARRISSGAVLRSGGFARSGRSATLRGGEATRLKIPGRRGGLRRRSAALAFPGNRLVARRRPGVACAAVPRVTSRCSRGPAAFPWSCSSDRCRTSARTALLDGEGATLELDPTSEQVGLFERRRETHRQETALRRARFCAGPRRHGTARRYGC